MAKYTEKWWDGLSGKQRGEIADAIEASNVTADLLEKHIDDLYDALVPWLRKIHVYVDQFDYSAAGEWVECHLDWDDDWYLGQALKGKTPNPGSSSMHDFVLAGVENEWDVNVESNLDDAVKDFHDAVRGVDPDSDEYGDARREFLDSLQDCMAELADGIESDVWSLFPYYYDDAEVEAIPHLIEDGVFDKVIDRYLATHRVNESYGRVRRSGCTHPSRKRIRVDGILYEAVERPRTRRNRRH